MPIQVGVVNIAPELPAFVVSEYAKAFDPEFEGFYLSQEDLSAFSEELGLSLPSANAVIPTNFSHPDALFLIEHVRQDFRELKQVFSATRLTKQQQAQKKRSRQSHRNAFESHGRPPVTSLPRLRRVVPESPDAL